MDETQTNQSDEIRNKSLYICLKEYIQEIFPLLKENRPGLRAKNSMGYRWVKRNTERQEYDLVEIEFPSVELGHKLQFIPSAEDCIREMRSDPVINAQLDNKVRFINLGRRVDPHGILWSFSENLSHETQEYRFDDQIFDTCYRDFENDFYQDTFSPQTILPLRGDILVDSIFLTAPVILTDDLRIDYLTEDDITLCLENGISLGKRMGTTVLSVSKFGIIYQPKVKIPIQSEESIHFVWPPPPENILTVLYALIVFRSCSFISHGYITTCDHTLFGGGASANIGTIRCGKGHPPLSLDNAACESFKSFFEKFNSPDVKDLHHIQVAINRFCFAATRTNWEDKIVDLLIVAEALFIKDGGEELRYRTSHGAAFFLGESTEERKIICNDMKDAYDLRSSIVHGWKRKKTKTNDRFVKDYKNKYEEYSSLTSKVEHYMRSALFKVITQCSPTDIGSDPLEWESKLFLT